jgi:hypothetical protein
LNVYTDGGDSLIEGRATIVAIAGGLFLSLAYGAWWVLTPDHAYSVRATNSRGARLVMDSPDVRQIIATEEKNREHILFTSPMADRPSILIPQGTYTRLLERSHAKCGAASEYARVRITSGLSRGAEGWLCFPEDVAPTAWRE